MLKTTGLFEIFEYTIPFKEWNQTFYLIPFGDIHRYAPLCDEEKWLEYLEWMKTKKDCFFLGMGDYDDLASTSERKILQSSELHEPTLDMIETTYRNRVKKFSKEIEFMKGRCIGMIGGNHYGNLQSGITTDHLIANELGTKFLGVAALVRLWFVNERLKQVLHVDICVHHGQGASRLLGGSLNRIQQMAEGMTADIYLMGHDHKKVSGDSSIIELKGFPGHIRMVERKRLYVRTGSFLRGYMPGQKSYITDRMANPTELGLPKIELTPKEKMKNGVKERYIDLHVSI